MNQQFQEQYANTIWKNYILVDVQWKIVNEAGIDKAEPQFVANSTLETYFQSTSSCLGCHVLASDLNMDKTSSDQYIQDEPMLYHLTIPMLVRQDSNKTTDAVLLGDLSYGIYEVSGLNITKGQVTSSEPPNPAKPPASCELE